jgi:hypothetical protein
MVVKRRNLSTVSSINIHEIMMDKVVPLVRQNTNRFLKAKRDVQLDIMRIPKYADTKWYCYRKRDGVGQRKRINLL